MSAAPMHNLMSQPLLAGLTGDAGRKNPAKHLPQVEAEAAQRNSESLLRIRRAKQRIAAGFYDRMLDADAPADSEPAQAFNAILERVQGAIDSSNRTRFQNRGDGGVFTRRIFGQA